MVADQYVAALGSHTAPLLRPLGIWLNIYPAKGFSATLRLKRPDDASVVSLLDDTRKIAISRLCNLWLNAGHGTLGWTHGAGSGQALAELISGKRPALSFGFRGDALPAARPFVAGKPGLEQR